MASLNSHARELARFWKGAILWDSPMAQFSTFRVGGPAEAVVTPGTAEELQQLMRWLHKNDIRWWVIGRGSNILVPDQGLAGVIIILEGAFRTIEKISAADKAPHGDRVFIQAGGGCLLSKLVSYCTARSLAGLEFAVGIPGTLGGAIVMNAGAWGSEIGTLVDSVSLMNGRGEITSEKGENLGFFYRKWSRSRDTVLLSATLSLIPGSREEIRMACRKYQDQRRQKQPLAEPSAGSFFKNPPADSAGRLIEAAGLKGFAVGGARISEKHANFIINTGHATAADILELMQVVQQTVARKFGIRLEPEVHILDGEQEQ